MDGPVFRCKLVFSNNFLMSNPDEEEKPGIIARITQAQIDQGEKQIKRDQWSNAIEFFITSLGFAVGLGNVWRFPYKVYSNGGAVFLIPYTLALVFLAIPLQMLEASIGQYSKKGPIGVWEMVPLLKGIGIATLYSTYVGKMISRHA